MARSRVIGITWFGLMVVAALATVANVASIGSSASSHPALNSITSVNTSVFAALLIGTLAMTEAPARELVAISRPLLLRRVVGAHWRATALCGLVSAVVFGAVVTGLAVALLALRGASLPVAHSVIGYVGREAIAAARLAAIGVAIGAVCRQRRTAVVTLIGFLALNGAFEAASPAFRNWGPVGVLNAFSDPTHHHQFSVGIGGLIALAWALLALITADLAIETHAGS
jgi:hypothetical protein